MNEQVIRQKTRLIAELVDECGRLRKERCPIEAREDERELCCQDVCPMCRQYQTGQKYLWRGEPAQAERPAVGTVVCVAYGRSHEDRLELGSGVVTRHVGAVTFEVRFPNRRRALYAPDGLRPAP